MVKASIRWVNNHERVKIGIYILKLRFKKSTPSQVKNKSPKVLVKKLIVENAKEYTFPFLATMYIPIVKCKMFSIIGLKKPRKKYSIVSFKPDIIVKHINYTKNEE